MYISYFKARRNSNYLVNTRCRILSHPRSSVREWRGGSARLLRHFLEWIVTLFYTYLKKNYFLKFFLTISPFQNRIRVKRDVTMNFHTLVKRFLDIIKCENRHEGCSVTCIPPAEYHTLRNDSFGCRNF